VAGLLILQYCISIGSIANTVFSIARVLNKYWYWQYYYEYWLLISTNTNSHYFYGTEWQFIADSSDTLMSLDIYPHYVNCTLCWTPGFHLL